MNISPHLPNRLVNVQLMVQQRIQLINSCSERISFIRETVALLNEIHNHPIIGSYFRNLEKTGKKLSYEVQKKLVYLYENEWKFLSKYCKTLRHKKQLLRIRNLLIRSNVISSASLPQRIYEQINDLRANLPLYKELQKIKSIIENFQKVKRQDICGCPTCKERRRNIKSNIICISFQLESIRLSFNFCEMEKNPLTLSVRHLIPCTDYLSSFFWEKFWKQNAAITPSGALSREFIESAMETDEIYFYGRMRLLKEINESQTVYSSSMNTRTIPKKFDLALWEKIKMTLWKQEIEKSHNFNLSMGLTQLNRNLSTNRRVEVNPFLCREYYFTKENIQHYLSLLQQRISLVLCEGKFNKSSSTEKICFTLSEQKRIRFREIVKEFWLKKPSGTLQECYENYKSQVGEDYYERSTFKKYIQRDNLDPRLADKKVRGKGRKNKKGWN